jgi:molybdenum ABC transporter molybdate-binding protein
MRRRIMAALAGLVLASSPVQAGEAVRVLAAGSLKAALTDVAAAFTQDTNVPVEAVYGPSGVLRDRIAKGEVADVFASANMEHPQALSAGGKAGPVAMFARNRLCALAQPEIRAGSDQLLNALLDPKVRVGTSMPLADPAGDYAWALFRKAEALRPGAYEVLERKTRQLTGVASAPRPPEGRTVYGVVMEARMADLFLTYCTNAVVAAREVPGLRVIQVPEPLAVAADYGMAELTAGDAGRARAFTAFLRSAAGQAILLRHGFATP